MKSLNAHDAFCVLKHCFSLPELLFILRCAPCCQSQFLLREYDTTIRTALQSIQNVQLSNAAWCQASVPVNKGGLGIRAASDVALPASLSPVVGSAALTSRLLPDCLSNVSGLNDELDISAWLISNLKARLIYLSHYNLQDRKHGINHWWQSQSTTCCPPHKPSWVLSALLRSQHHMPERI